ncbi:HTH domain-containing protein [Curtobacterium sp. ZW137]|uniref:HTH domain-containing protein n=1 Tax=Curtobacterium sp. ZW137 TaxID=2485104 RepID=UPI000F4C0418|nr:HTH domain-containing protein [Curtobacterium sp. ZW137]
MTEKQDVAHELRHIVEVDGVPYDTIGAITGTTPEKLRSYVETSPNGFADPADGGLSPDEGARVSVLVAHLSAVKEIPDAERVEGMLAVLTQTFGFPSMRWRPSSASKPPCWTTSQRLSTTCPRQSGQRSRCACPPS